MKLNSLCSPLESNTIVICDGDKNYLTDYELDTTEEVTTDTVKEMFSVDKLVIHPMGKWQADFDTIIFEG